MKFAYYRRLDARRRRIYDRSDEAAIVRVPAAAELEPIVVRVGSALANDDRTMTEATVQQLVDAILRRLHVPAVSVRVLAVRPSSHREELHGLYEFGGRRVRPLITVWMRTAQRRQVVAFRTFLRTLLHEVVHHLDYQLLRLEDSMHTEGFYKRAEALYRQLAPDGLVTTSGAAADAREVGEERPRRRASKGSHGPSPIVTPIAPRAARPKPVPRAVAAAAKPNPAAPIMPALPASGPQRRPRRAAEEAQPLLPFMT